MKKSKTKERQIFNLKLSLITIPKHRARINFSKEKIKELMISIEQHGIIHPIIVKGIKGGYEIVAGDRRFTACKNLKLATIPAEIFDGTELDNELIKLHENMMRDDLDDIEEANFLRRLMKLTKKDTKYIASIIGKSNAFVQQKIAILNYPDYLYNAIAEHIVTFSAARELIRITDQVTLREYVGFAINSGITPAIAKKWADEWLLREELAGISVEAAEKKTEAGLIEEPLFLCQYCGQAKKVSETRLVRICNDSVQCENYILEKRR